MEKQHPVLYVLIADHEPEVRQALRLICEESLGLTVAAEAADSHELLARISITPSNLLLLEWELPGLQAQDLIKTLRADQALSIIVIGGQPEARTEALEAGANGFVYKGDPPDHLLSLLGNVIETRSP